MMHIPNINKGSKNSFFYHQQDVRELLKIPILANKTVIIGLF